MSYKLSVSIPTSNPSIIIQSISPDSEINDRVTRTLTASKSTGPSGAVDQLVIEFNGKRAKDVRVAARSCLDDVKLLIRAEDELSEL
ncbi:hypothetical protein TrRE_jg3552 [Triparma retinervis]|uniref:Uncharacterized protein n=1 Tax=Triparma retinervis TaxID=2557542 RepID=A0A9W7DWR2_9STRA|nr:hypothetical protein TrRE_jg3552 [Triparma retinervis]